MDRETAEDIFGLIMHFAGYGFNKAHTSAYAFIAFITAYLKAHYTTEFMAASLSCEMGNTDEVVKLMGECGALGIEVLPPDINESRADFTPVGEGKLRFGLGAVKNVGSKAIECILAARDKEGPFTSLFGFCERVDSHEVTKGAVEGLMKAGCFDGLPGDRAQQLAVLETAIRVGARARKNRQIGQHTLFGQLAEDDPEKRMAANLPDVPPLAPQELAGQEKEALGLYVRYEPLVQFRGRLRRFCTAFSDGLASVTDGAEVVMGGVVEKVRRRSTRAGDPMAILTVLDVSNSFECVLFPRTCQKYGELAEVGQVLFFTGRVSHARGTSLQVAEVVPFEKMQAGLANAVFVTVPCQEAELGVWSALGDVLARNSGKVPVFVNLVSDGWTLQARVGVPGGVNVSDRLAQQIEEVVGDGCVRFGIRQNGGEQGTRRRRRAGGYANPGN